MSKKFSLFASVAVPFVSLPLMMQPATAMPLKPAFETGHMPGLIQVQQPLVVPPGAPGAGEGEGRPRRQQQEQAPAERPQGQGQAQPQQQEQPRRQRPAEPEAAPREAAPPRQAPQAERPAAPPRAEAPSAPRAEPPAPKAEQPATPRAEPPAARQNPSPAAPEGNGRQPPRNNPDRETAPVPGKAEAPTPPPRATPPQTERPVAPPAPPKAEAPVAPPIPKAEPPAAKQAPPATPGNAPDRNAPPAPGKAEAPAPGKPEAPKPEPRATDRAPTPQTVPGQAPVPGAAQDNRPQQPPAAQAAPGQNVPGQNPPGQPNPRPTTQGQGQTPPGQPPQAQAPQPQPGNQPPQGEQPRRQTEGQQQRPVPGQPVQGQVPQGQPPQVQSAPQQAIGAQPGAQPGAQQPPTAVTPQQVDRAREIARDPKAAKPGEQVVLPVQNGAAVLDSAKEAPVLRGPQGAPGNGDSPRRPPPPPQAGQPVAPPKSDADAQTGTRATREQQAEIKALGDERGQKLDGRPQFDRPGGWDFRDPTGRDGNPDRNAGRDRNRDNGRDNGPNGGPNNGRVIISIDNQNVVRHDDSRRFYDDNGRQPQYDQLRDGRVRDTITRDDGTRIVTIRNRYGEIVQRSRIVRGGQEYILYSAPELLDNSRDRNYVWRDPGDDLPAMRLSVPLDDYIIDTSRDPNRDYYKFLEQPPVERVERVYSLDEVRYSARIRDKVPRIDLDTITFATGSAEIPMNQASSLRKVADAINQVLARDPSETFLIEGHTDAVGSDDSNLVLSDERAESVARVLSDAFKIPPENLATQGYGERYLKVRTDGPEQQNRRVTIRRITPLVKPVASK